MLVVLDSVLLNYSQQSGEAAMMKERALKRGTLVPYDQRSTTIRRSSRLALNLETKERRCDGSKARASVFLYELPL